MTWENMTNRFQNGPQPPQDLASREFIAVLLFDEWHPLDLSLRFAPLRHGTVALHELPVLQLSGCWAQSGSVSFVLGKGGKRQAATSGYKGFLKIWDG